MHDLLRARESWADWTWHQACILSAVLASYDPDGKVRAFNLWPGPIGSGSAVIANDHSEVREYLRQFNDKTLAVETEAAGLADAFYQNLANSAQDGWLAVRGISDKANSRKNDKFHRIAAWHAVMAFTEMLPDLVPEGS